MVHRTRIELVFPPWKGSVLTDRRTVQNQFKFLKNNLYYNRTGNFVNQRCFKTTIFGVRDRDRTCIIWICNPRPNHSATHAHNLAESIGFEPMRRFRNDSLANCSFNHSGNSPNFGGSGEIRTHGTFLFVCFQDRCNKPGSATLPLIGRGSWIRTNDTDFKDQGLRPLGDTPTNQTIF